MSYVEAEIRVPGRTEVFVRCPVLGAGGTYLLVQVPIGSGLPWIRKGAEVEIRRRDGTADSATVHLRSLRPVPLLALQLEGPHLTSLLVHPEVGRTVLVTGGKGGTGKTFVAVNAALLLAQRGLRTLLLDADLGAPNVAIQLGTPRSPHLGDLLEGQRQPAEVVQRDVRPGLSVLPGAPGGPWGDSSPWKLGGLVSLIHRMRRDFDAIVVDTGPGVGSTPTGLFLAADQALFITSDEQASLADTLTLLDIALASQFFRGQAALVLNRVREPGQAIDRLAPLQGEIRAKRGVEIPLWGSIQDDPRVYSSGVAGVPYAEAQPLSPTTVALRAIAQRMMP